MDLAFLTCRTKIEKEKKEHARLHGMIRTEISGAEIAEEMEKERRLFQLQMCEVRRQRPEPLQERDPMHPSQQPQPRALADTVVNFCSWGTRAGWMVVQMALTPAFYGRLGAPNVRNGLSGLTYTHTRSDSRPPGAWGTFLWYQWHQ